MHNRKISYLRHIAVVLLITFAFIGGAFAVGMGSNISSCDDGGCHGGDFSFGTICFLILFFGWVFGEPAKYLLYLPFAYGLVPALIIPFMLFDIRFPKWPIQNFGAFFMVSYVLGWLIIYFLEQRDKNN